MKMAELDSFEYTEEREARLLAQQIGNFINGHGTSKYAMDVFSDEMAHRTHRTLQQSFMRYLWVLFQTWSNAKADGYYDLRNEATVELADKIVLEFEADAAFPFI
jgi:hypothetical protein